MMLFSERRSTSTRSDARTFQVPFRTISVRVTCVFRMNSDTILSLADLPSHQFIKQSLEEKEAQQTVIIAPSENGMGTSKRP